jgi:hypothetical protein
MDNIDGIISGCVKYLEVAIKLPDEAKNTLPTVFRKNGAYVVSVGFYQAESGLVKDRPRRFYFPFVQCHYNSATGQYTHEQISAMSFGIKDKDRPAGDFRHLAGLTMSDFRAASGEYSHLLADVVTNKALDAPTSVSKGVRDVAGRLSHLITVLREPDLSVYYAHFSKELDSWISAR